MSTAPKSHKISIDLSGKPKESVETIFLSWAINAGRVIIMVTELIALGALFYRFVIDRQINDLNDQVNRQKIFVTLQQAKEDKYRGVQERLALIKETDEATHKKLDVMNGILSAINNTSAFTQTNLSVSENTITVSGNSANIFAINDLINNLVQKYPDIKNVDVGQMDSVAQGIQFKLTITLKESAVSAL
jgi:hypothetical protein